MLGLWVVVVPVVVVLCLVLLVLVVLLLVMGGALDLLFGALGGLDLLFRFLRVPCGPLCPPGGFIEDLCGNFGIHLETKIDQFWCGFLMCFRDGFLIGFKVV